MKCLKLHLNLITSMSPCGIRWREQILTFQKILKQKCEEIKIDYLCTPFSRDGADELDEIGLEFLKVGSGEMTNLPLIEHIAKKNKPMIVSTGMSTLKR